MKKKTQNVISKITKVLAVFLIMGVTLYSSIANVKAAPSSIQIGGTDLSEAYIGTTRFGIKKLADGSYAYCLDRTLGTPANITATLVGEKDAGYAYILLNGYPNKSLTGDAGKDYYITQTAVWWYIDETTGTSNLPTSFKTTDSDPSGLRTYIKSLVNGAIAAKAQGYPTPSLNLTTSDKTMTLSSDKQYYVSKSIDANANNITGNYTVSITSGPTGTIVTDESGNIKSSFAAGEKFLVKVPVANVGTGSVKVKITADASLTVYKAYEYSTGNAQLQNTLPGILYPETKAVSSTIELEIEASKLSIIKLDQDTKNPLPGAELQLTDADGTVVTTWTSTTKAHVIQNLPVGKYYLTETKAPEGYTLNKESVEITITSDTREVEAVMYNKAKKVVVNIIKVDSITGDALSGAVLKVKDAKGKTVAEFTTTNQAYVLTDLEYGTYTVEEVSAPEGYELSKDIITFTVDENNQTHQIIFNNKKICGPGDVYGPDGELCNPGTSVVNVPNTMTTSGMVTTVLGLIVIAAAAGFVYRNGKKEQKN